MNSLSSLSIDNMLVFFLYHSLFTCVTLKKCVQKTWQYILTTKSLGLKFYSQ